MSYVITGARLHSRDFSSEQEGCSRLREPGRPVLPSKDLIAVYAGLIMQLFVPQLSVTIGMVLAYVLGMLVPWRMLAMIGNMTKC